MRANLPEKISIAGEVHRLLGDRLCIEVSFLYIVIAYLLGLSKAKVYALVFKSSTDRALLYMTPLCPSPHQK